MTTKMSNVFRLAALLTLSAVAALAESNGIAAVVNGRPILRSEVNELVRYKQLELRHRVSDAEEFAAEKALLHKKALDSLIDQELILKEFEPFQNAFGAKIEAYADEAIKTQFINTKYKGDRHKFLTDLTASGMSISKFKDVQKRNVISEMMRGQFASPDAKYLTSDERKAYLAKHGADFREGDKIKLWSIAIEGEPENSTRARQEALAKEIRTKLLKGDDFSGLAKTYSSDSKAQSGGSWDWIEEKTFTPAMWELVSKLDAKKISDVVSFGGDYYIFWIEAKVLGQLKSKEEIEPVIERRIMAEKRQVASDEWLAKLRKKATIIYK